MEQVTPDSTVMPAWQDDTAHGRPDRGVEAAVTQLLTGGAPPSRRSILAGILGASAPIPALAFGTEGDHLQHPDQWLLDTEADLVRATVAAEEASAASSAAHTALWDALGPCPTNLVAPHWIVGRLSSPSAHSALRHRRLFQMVKMEEGDDGCKHAWTGPGLRAVIEYAVPVFGTGGQTPHRIREWRALTPTVDAFGERRAHLERLYQVRELSDASRKARDLESLLSRKLATFTASTLDGLGAITRHIGTFGWDRMPSAWIGLLLSVAKITHVDLGIADFDVERWADELRAVGGRITPPNRYDSGGVQFPISHTQTDEEKATIARLSREQQDHKIQVRLFVERGGLAA